MLKIYHPFEADVEFVYDGKWYYCNVLPDKTFRGSVLTPEQIGSLMLSEEWFTCRKGGPHKFSDIKFTQQALPKPPPNLFDEAPEPAKKDIDMTEKTELLSPADFFNDLKDESGTLLKAGASAQVANRVSGYATEQLVKRIPEDWRPFFAPVLEYGVVKHVVGVAGVASMVGMSWLLRGMIADSWLIFAQKVARHAGRGYLVIAGFDGAGAGIDITLSLLRGLKKELSQLSGDFNLGDLASEFSKEKEGVQ